MLDFIHLIFKVLTISMRFEPSNAKYFNVEVGWESITTVLRLTGAFTDNVTVKVEEKEWTLDSAELKQQLAACHSVFKMDEAIQLGSIPSGTEQIIQTNARFYCFRDARFYLCQLLSRPIALQYVS